MPRQLGCAQNYYAALHFQGGTMLHTRLDGLTDLSWGRKLDDFSEASVTLAKKNLGRECCRALGQVTPWAHELTIYRDSGIVWQGPVVEPEETRTHLTLSARDMLAWLDRRVIDHTWPRGQGTLDTGAMLAEIMRITFPPGDPYNNPGLSEWMRIDASTPGRQSFTETIWKGSQTVGELVRELIKNGIDMFTLGRKIYMIPDFYRVSHAPYRLSSDDFLADVTLRMRGLDLATEGFVIADSNLDQGTEPDPGGNPDNPAPTYAKYPVGHHGGSGDPSAPPWFGRITKFSNAGQQVDPRALEGIAQAIRGYGFPCPKSILVPDGAQLSPRAPVSIGQLVPGRPFRVTLADFCIPASELYRLNEVEVTWSESEVEKVAISLATMRQPPVEDTGTAAAAKTVATPGQGAPLR